MHLDRTYRSLPRPSSKFKPSYPSNSFIESIFLFDQSNHLFSLDNFRRSYLNQMSILVISYTVLIEYKTGVSRHSQTPQTSVAEFGSSLIFLKADLLSHSS
jgi:hypothetical protein